MTRGPDPTFPYDEGAVAFYDEWCLFSSLGLSMQRTLESNKIALPWGLFVTLFFPAQIRDALDVFHTGLISGSVWST